MSNDESEQKPEEQAAQNSDSSRSLAQLLQEEKLSQLKHKSAAEGQVAPDIPSIHLGSSTVGPNLPSENTLEENIGPKNLKAFNADGEKFDRGQPDVIESRFVGDRDGSLSSNDDQEVARDELLETIDVGSRLDTSFSSVIGGPPTDQFLDMAEGSDRQFNRPNSEARVEAAVPERIEADEANSPTEGALGPVDNQRRPLVFRPTT